MSSQFIYLFPHSTPDVVPLCHGQFLCCSAQKTNTGLLDRLARLASSVVDMELEALASVVEKKDPEDADLNHGQLHSTPTSQHTHYIEEHV